MSACRVFASRSRASSNYSCLFSSLSSGVQVREALEPSATEPVRPPERASGSPPASSILRRWTSRISRRMAASASRYCSSVSVPSSRRTWSSRSYSFSGASSVHCSSATLRRVFMMKLKPLNGARRRSSIKNIDQLPGLPKIKIETTARLGSLSVCACSSKYMVLRSLALIQSSTAGVPVPRELVSRRAGQRSSAFISGESA